MLLIYNYDMRRWLVLQPGGKVLAIDVHNGKESLVLRSDYARYVKGTHVIAYLQAISSDLLDVLTSVCAVMPHWTAEATNTGLGLRVGISILFPGGGLALPQRSFVKADAVRACFRGDL